MNKVCLTSDGTLLWYCPGCRGGHGVPVIGARVWDWNKSLTSPTLSPSVLVHSHARWQEEDQPRCHVFIREGKIQFLADCSHSLAGQTVDVPPWE